ncbi:hypothetical protein [uncultured Sphingomonas sp.]|uniref:hypothetical protein n=1 Tax=uncultured Sphingomonas sp. TaxID=158754 RepID=UPI0035CA429B
MRLLLLLSALLSALSGLGGTRAQAQFPVAASAAGALSQTAGSGLIRRVPLPFAQPSPTGASPAALPATPTLVSAVLARRLFAERRRE